MVWGIGVRIRRQRICRYGVVTPFHHGEIPGLLQDMEANSSSRNQSDSVLIPVGTLQSFLGANSTDISVEAFQLADENGWTAKPAPDGHWLFERKVA